MTQSEYVLVTPARNEEAFIGKTIDTVLSQTVLPRTWVIVSDGSIDRTDEIVRSYAQRHTFIQLLRAGDAGDPGRRDFGNKVLAFRAGYDKLKSVSHEFVGNLDADISLSPRYFEQVLKRFRANPRLGCAGGLVLEPRDGRFVAQKTSLNSVCGSVQLFRRECYEAFGGYIPIRGGGVDAAAEILARMHGWEVQTLPDVEVHAQRRVITGGANTLHTSYRLGISNHRLGYHPFFQLASSLSRAADRPILIGSLMTLLGYGRSWLKGEKNVLPPEAVRFLRSEQMGRLTTSLTGWNRVWSRTYGRNR